MDCDCIVVCPEDIDDGQHLTNSYTQYFINREPTTVSFGSVPIGSKATRIFTIKNLSKDDLEFVVQCDPDANTLYKVFNYHYNERVRKNSMFKCYITYSPFQTSNLDVDYLLVRDKKGRGFPLILKGRCIGPHISISQTELVFSTCVCQPTSKTIEVSNNSEAIARFCFDVKDKTIGCFSVDVVSGTLQPRKHIYLTITFTPTNYGVHHDDLYLLVLNYKPFHITMIGIYSEQQIFSRDANLAFYQTPSAKSGYSGYLRDIAQTCTTLPPFSLSEASIDFGGIDLNYADDKTRIMVTSLTNHLTNPIRVIWAEDPRGVFKITPEDVVIPSEESVLLECCFSPKCEDRFFDVIMSGAVVWHPGNSFQNGKILVPLPVHIRLLASTFPPEQGWIPQIILPDEVILRPCPPNFATHASFLMMLNGRLPVSYRFVPPKKTKFIVKPLHGVVTDIQIVVVQYMSETEHSMAYTEKWAIVLNHKEKQCHYIQFSGYCETPRLVVNGNNKILFEPVMPNCQVTQLVSIKNISCHYTTYKICLTDDSPLQFSHYEGDIAANEEITLRCVATGKECTPCSLEVIIEQRVSCDSVTVGNPNVLKVLTKLRIVNSELIAIPNFIDLEQVCVDQKVTATFSLANFCESTVHCKILLDHPDPEQLIKLRKYVNFSPSQVDVVPESRRKIKIAVQCEDSGYFEVLVAYHVRLCSDSAIVVSTQPKVLLKLIFAVKYPTIQITTIVDYSNGLYFSKAALWKLCNIEKVNDCLSSIKKGENRSVAIALADSEVTDEEFSLTVELQNVSDFDTTVEMKRHKVCECPLVARGKSLSFRQKAFSCIHRDMFRATLSNTNFKSMHCQKLTLTAKYLKSMNMQMAYSLHLSDSRSVLIFFTYNILRHDVDQPSRYANECVLNLGSVSLNEKYPPYHSYWFYNPSLNNVKVGAIHDGTAKRRNFDVVSLLNDEVKTMQSYSSCCLLFKFDPLEYKQFKCSYSLLLGSTEKKLLLTAYGSSHVSNAHASHYEICAKKPTLQEPGITFSTDYIQLPPLLSWSSMETILFMKNNTKDTIGYSLETNIIPGILTVSATHSKGVLKPKDVHPVVVRLEAFDTPFKINVHLRTKYLNHTQYFIAKKSQLEYNAREENIKEEFIITEKGVEYPENTVVVKPSPSIFFKTIMVHAVSISVFDVDLHMNANEQLIQSPQYVLHLNESKIRSVLAPSVKQIEKPIHKRHKKLIKSEEKEQHKPAAKQVENVEVLKDAIECIILSALQSKVFKKALAMKFKNDPPYYIQFDVEPQVHHTQVQKSKWADLKKTINISQPPGLANIFRELISDAMHKVMHIGPPIGERLDRHFIYDSTFKNRCKEAK